LWQSVSEKKGRVCEAGGAGGSFGEKNEVDLRLNSTEPRRHLVFNLNKKREKWPEEGAKLHRLETISGVYSVSIAYKKFGGKNFVRSREPERSKTSSDRGAEQLKVLKAYDGNKRLEGKA